MNGELLAEYRRTWKEFSSKLNQLQELDGSKQPVLAAAALLDVEKARAEHNAARDRFAKSLTRREFSSLPASAKKQENRIRRTARLIWEFSGKPQNSAEADWHQAEKLVRAASV